jgi:hypothetical protein
MYHFQINLLYMQYNKCQYIDLMLQMEENII